MTNAKCLLALKVSWLVNSEISISEPEERCHCGGCHSDVNITMSCVFLLLGGAKAPEFIPGWAGL